MSKKYPECPLYNHDSCKELHNSKLCAIVRKDKTCFKKISKTRKNAQTKESWPQDQALVSSQRDVI